MVSVQNRWQHFVPIGFMKSWGIHETSGPSSFIWQIDPTATFRPRKIAVRSVCASEFTYSELNPLFEQELFRSSDNDLPVLIAKLLKDGALDEADQRSLFCLLVLLHSRSPDFRNSTGGERMATVVPSWLTFIEVLLELPHSASVQSFAEHVVRAFASRWTMKILFSPAGLFLSSDNPVLMLHGPAGRELWAPLSPFYYVGFSTQTAPAERWASPIDAHTFNRAQVVNCIASLFSHLKPADSRLVALKEDWAQRVSLRSANAARGREVSRKGVRVVTFSTVDLAPGVWGFRKGARRGL